MHRAILLGSMAAGLWGCEKEPKEAAPINSGDTLSYVFEVGGGTSSHKYQATIGMTVAASNEITLVSDPPMGNEPETVNKALATRKHIQMHSLGMLWLPTQQRAIGGQTPVGTVRKQRKYNRFEVFSIPQPGQMANERYYDVTTGFLVGYNVDTPGGPAVARLERSTVGL